MKLADATLLVAKLEREAALLAAAISATSAARSALSAPALEKLTEAFPSPAKAKAFLEGMPKTPNAEAILGAFASPAALAKLVDTTLGGNVRALAVLAERGCNRDPAKLKTFAETFDGDADFQVVFTQGGFAERPEALAALLQVGCGGDPATLKTLCEKFKNPADALKLAGALGAGGLGQSPEALGALAAQGHGDALKRLADQFTTPDDHGKLADLLTKGGLGGKAPGRPALLADVIRDGLGNDPARLKELHAGFIADGDAGLRQMADMLTALDGNDQNGGKRLRSAIEGFKLNNAGLSDAGAAQKLRDPFMKSIAAKGRAAAAPDIAGGSADRGAAAAATIKPPPVTLVAGRLDELLAAPGAAQPDAMAQALILGPQAAGLAGGPALIAARAAGLGHAAASGDADPVFTGETKSRSEALKLATAALLKPMEGPVPQAVADLQALADTLLDRLTEEPDAPVRAAALTAASEAGQAITTALRRLSASNLARSGPAGAAVADLAVVSAQRAGASEAEKAALAALASATMTAAAAVAAAGGDLDASTQAAGEAINGLEAGQRIVETGRRNEAAKAAATHATAAAAELAKAPAPVDPALVARVAHLAALSAMAGSEAPGKPEAQAALDAAKLAGEAAAAAASRVAAASRQAAAMASTEAKKSLVAGVHCDRVEALLATAGQGAQAAQVAEVAAAVRAGALSLDAAERALTVGEAAATDTAKAAMARAPGDPLVATTQANAAAQAAGLLAAAEALKLDTPPLTSALVLAAQAAAQEALRIAPVAVDPAIRKTALEQARDALKKVAAAGEGFAAAQLAAAKTALKTQQKTRATTASASRDALVTDWMPGGPGTMAPAAAAANYEACRAALNDTAGAYLSEFVLTDPAVGTARDAAVEAAALAAVPGADRLSRITALETARDADKAVAVKALGEADLLVNALPAAPVDADASDAELTGGRDQLFRDASAALEAASAAAARWRESAVAVVEAVRVATAEFAAIAGKSPAETTDEVQVTARQVPADNEVVAARAQQALFKGAASTMMQLHGKTGAWARWVNLQGKHANAMANDIVNTHGIAIGQASEGARNAENFTAMPRETLIRNAATLKRQMVLPGAGTNYTEPCTMSAAGDAVNRKKHIAGRHGRESYEYGNLADGGPTPEQYAAARVLAARFTSGVASPTHPASGDKAPPTADPKLKNLVKLGHDREKVNSLLPEEVTNTNLTAVTQKALIALRDAMTPPTMAQLMSTIGSGFFQQLVLVDIPPVRQIKIGVRNQGGKPKADMMYGDSTNTMTMPDMAVMGRAIGL